MENNWKFYVIQMVVKDLDKAVEYYESLGIGPFKPEVIIDRKTAYEDLKLSATGGSMTAKHRARMVQLLDSVRLELIQNIEGDSHQKGFLDSRGEGVVNLTFIVDDLETETAKLAEKGVPVIFSGTRPNDWLAIYDTRKVGNLFIELIQHKKQNS